MGGSGVDACRRVIFRSSAYMFGKRSRDGMRFLAGLGMAVTRGVARPGGIHHYLEIQEPAGRVSEGAKIAF
jgi:hypothetical protein